MWRTKNPLLKLYFLWIAVAIINAELPKIIKMAKYNTRWLDRELGYTPNLLSPITFDLMAGQEARIHLYDKNDVGIMSLLLGGWYNTKSSLSSTRNVRYRGRILSGTHFKSFMIAYDDTSVQIYRDVGKSWSRFMILTDIKKLEPARISLQTKWATAQWIFPYFEKQNKTDQKIEFLWKTDVSLMNTKFLDNVMWSKDVSNLGACAVLCSNDGGCTSYSFNPETKKCQGHLGNYYYTNGRNYITEANVVYYFKYSN